MNLMQIAHDSELLEQKTIKNYQLIKKIGNKIDD